MYQEVMVILGYDTPQGISEQQILDYLHHQPKALHPEVYKVGVPVDASKMGWALMLESNKQTMASIRQTAQTVDLVMDQLMGISPMPARNGHR